MKIQETPWESRRLQLLCIMTDGHKRSENAEEGRRQLRLTLALVLHLVKNERGVAIIPGLRRSFKSPTQTPSGKETWWTHNILTLGRTDWPAQNTPPH